jgi:hypothetical protein
MPGMLPPVLVSKVIQDFAKVRVKFLALPQINTHVGHINVIYELAV